jgi:hypothetical protein
LTPAITAYAAGQRITFKAAAASTTASTLNVNTLGTKALKKRNDQDIAAGDIEVGSIVTAVYDGTSFQVTSQLASDNAATADALSTARTIASSGDVVWSVSFDGSAAVTSAATIQASSVDGSMIALGSDASGDVMYYSGSAWARLAKGSDDEILTLASGIPSWAAAAAGGGLQSMQVFTASATYTRPAGITSALVFARACGGGGGGVSDASASKAASGGGQGGLAIAFVTPSATETVTIGAAGTAGSSSGGNGGTGGNVSFGSTATANGGLPGLGATAAGDKAGGLGGAGGTGDIAIRGAPGGNGSVTTGGNDWGIGHGGGEGGGNAPQAGDAGTAGVRGGGGSGCGRGSGVNTTGGAGGVGYIIVYEFA